MSDFNIFPGSNDGVIWSIDDGWFTGEQSLDAQLQLALSISKELNELKGKLLDNPNFHRNFGYLQTLVELCLQHGFALGLGSFEYFQKEFEGIDSHESAVLLDVRNPHSGDEQVPAESYGVYLLHELLKGSRPKSDIFFVTAYPDNVQQTLQHKDRQNDPTWWHLLSTRVISKHNGELKEVLNTFFENFANRLNNQDRFRELASSLIDERRKGGDHTHPQTVEQLKEKHPHLPLLSSFLSAESTMEGAGLQSYSALYHAPASSNQEIPHGVYPISSNLFSDHIRYLGVRLEVKEDREFLLPAMPGLVFVLYFCRFVQSLNPPVPDASLSFMRESNEDRACLSVSLNDTGKFRASVMGSEVLGRATKWFKRTLRGEGRFVLKLAERADSEEVPWVEFSIKKAKIYPLLVEPTIAVEGIMLKWKC